MFGQRRFGKVQTGLLVVIALVMGANLISPAIAHVTRKLNHLYKHLDTRYYNVGEKVGAASTADSAATAQNADALDNIDSSGFARAAQGLRGYFVLNGPQIQNTFSASGGTFVHAVNGSGSDTIDVPFPVGSGVVLVTMGAGRSVGGTEAGCFPQVQNVDADTILIEVTRHDGAACNEEVTVAIF